MDAHALTEEVSVGGAGVAPPPTYLESLLAAGLLMHTGVPGLVGRRALF